MKRHNNTVRFLMGTAFLFDGDAWCLVFCYFRSSTNNSVYSNTHHCVGIPSETFLTEIHLNVE